MQVWTDKVRRKLRLMAVVWVFGVAFFACPGWAADGAEVGVVNPLGMPAEGQDEAAQAEPTPGSVNIMNLDPAINPNYAYYEWADNPPSDCAFEKSQDLDRIVFTGRYANYTFADTWYFSWAADGNNYSCWTDGVLLDWPDPKAPSYLCVSGYPRQAPWSTGQIKIIGDDPLNLEFVNLGKMVSDKYYYPCVSVVANGVFYIGTYQAYNLEPGNGFDGFRYSNNWDHFTEEHEDQWTNPYWMDATDDPEYNGFDNPTGTTEAKSFDGTKGLLVHNFFNETGKAKFRVPHAVNFGQDNRLSPDGKIYLTAHGYDGGSGQNNWDKGDAVYLCRVKADPAHVINPQRYEFFAGHSPKGKPVWSKKVEDSKPILSWPDHLGSEGMTYIPGLKKYILMTCRLKEGEHNLPYNVFVIWESDNITGPFKRVHYLRDWGPQTYFPTIPSKFISPDGKTAWLVVTSNYSSGVAKPTQCRAACSMHEIQFLKPGEAVPTPPPLGKNIAPQAKIEVISTADGYSAAALTDGVIDGYPNDPAKEWASFSCRQDGWIRLRWETPVRINKIRLYDRPMESEHVLGARIIFSDGSTEYLRCWMSNKALAPGEVTFPPKKVTWLKVVFDNVSLTTVNVGLAEIEVYQAPSGL